MIPDIFIPATTVKSDTKYDIILKANKRKVSVIGFTRRKLALLKIRLVMKPKINPIVKETKPSIQN